ncbi:MAG TPA: hypothetical protein VFV50_12210 [Bdellovibrionales bacterium]|nr:hypothetical protein [Bdellovibrionales bacterium]
MSSKIIAPLLSLSLAMPNPGFARETCEQKINQFKAGAIDSIRAIKRDLHANIETLPNEADQERGRVAVEKLESEFYTLLRIFRSQSPEVRGTFDTFLEHVYRDITAKNYNSAEIFNDLASGIKAGRLSRYVTIASARIWGGAIDDVADIIYTRNRKIYDAILSERTIPQQDISILALLLIEFVSRTRTGYFDIRKNCTNNIATPMLDSLLGPASAATASGSDWASAGSN